MGWRGILVWCLRKYLCLMFCRYCQTERETLVSEKEWLWWHGVRRKKNPLNPFNEDTVPYFAFLSSAYVEGLSRVLTHCILESFPSHMEKSTKTSYTFIGHDREISSVYFVLQNKSSPGFLQIPLFSTYSLLVSVSKKPV